MTERLSYDLSTTSFFDTTFVSPLATYTVQTTYPPTPRKGHKPRPFTQIWRSSYNVPNPIVIGEIELHRKDMHGDVVNSFADSSKRSGGGKDVRPSRGNTLGISGQKDFNACDGGIYGWEWQDGLGWRVSGSLNSCAVHDSLDGHAVAKFV